MLAGCVGVDVEAHLAKTDAVLLASVVLAQYALARAYLSGAEARRPEAGWGTAFLFWTALAAGILIKGPMILMPVLATLLWLRMTEKNLAWFGVSETLSRLSLHAAAGRTVVRDDRACQPRRNSLPQSAGHDMLGKIWAMAEPRQ